MLVQAKSFKITGMYTRLGLWPNFLKMKFLIFTTFSDALMLNRKFEVILI